MRGQKVRETVGKKNDKEDLKCPLLGLTMSWSCLVLLNNPRFLNRRNNIFSQSLAVLKI